MKLKIASDLHLNHYHPYEQNQIRNRVLAGDYDRLILAGDIDTLKGTYSPIVSQDTIWPKSIIVLGNHELYRKGYDNGIKTNYTATIGDQKFVCSTMFSRLNPPDIPDIVQGITDFQYVSAKKFQELFEEAEAFLKKEVVKDCVVVTHFVPTFECLHPIYKGSTLNSFFMTEFSDLILEREPKIWVCGHTHCHWNFTLGKTRIVCNPLGYPFEPSEFDPDLIIEI